MILSDDVSDDESIDDGAECDGDYVEPRKGDSESEKLRRMITAALKWRLLTTLFISKDKIKWLKR